MLWVEDPETGCWDWVGSTLVDGTPTLWRNMTIKTAAPIIYEIYRQRKPSRHLRSTCGRRGCVNPRHRMEVVHVDSTREARARRDALRERLNEAVSELPPAPPKTPIPIPPPVHQNEIIGNKK